MTLGAKVAGVKTEVEYVGQEVYKEDIDAVEDTLVEGNSGVQVLICDWENNNGDASDADVLKGKKDEDAALEEETDANEQEKDADVAPLEEDTDVAEPDKKTSGIKEDDGARQECFLKQEL